VERGGFPLPFSSFRCGIRKGAVTELITSLFRRAPFLI
jgi:hypothetical protein